MFVSKFINSLSIIKTRGILTFLLAVWFAFLTNLLKIFLKKKYFLKNIYNYKLWLDLNDKGISRSLILFGKRENDQKYIIEKVLKASMKIFDIGANIGYYVLLQNNKIGNKGKILAIEPSPKNVKLLKKNLSVNNLRKGKVKIIEGAVSNFNGNKKFYLSNQSNLHTFHKNGSAKDFLNGNTINVEVFRLSKIIKENYSPDLIRMDIEGHEVEILESIYEDLQKKAYAPPIICFEPHISSYNQNHDLKPILKRLFKINYFTDYLSSNSFDGTKRIKSLNKKYVEEKLIESDGETRDIFRNINAKDTISILTKIGGARTVLLNPK